MDKTLEDVALMRMAERWEKAGVVAATVASSDAPWYKNARPDLAHSANCFAVAAALRARAAQPSPVTSDNRKD